MEQVISFAAHSAAQEADIKVPKPYATGDGHAERATKIVARAGRPRAARQKLPAHGMGRYSSAGKYPELFRTSDAATDC